MTMDTDAEKRAPGRKRDETTRAAILDAAFDTIEADGYRGFTIERVAARSGAGKTTIYRWWPTKEELAFDALLRRFVESEEGGVPAYNGSVIEGIRLYLRRLGQSFDGKAGKVLASFLGGGQCEVGAAALFRERFLGPRRDKGRMALQKGIATGEIRPDIDIDAALDALISPFFFRLLLRSGPTDAAFADRIADTVIKGIATSSEAERKDDPPRTSAILEAAETHAIL